MATLQRLYTLLDRLRMVLESSASCFTPIAQHPVAGVLDRCEFAAQRHCRDDASIAAMADSITEGAWR